MDRSIKMSAKLASAFEILLTTRWVLLVNSRWEGIKLSNVAMDQLNLPLWFISRAVHLDELNNMRSSILLIENIFETSTRADTFDELRGVLSEQHYVIATTQSEILDSCLDPKVRKNRLQEISLDTLEEHIVRF